MEAKFSKIRRELDSLGYFQILSLDSVPLVEKLVGDLKTTTISLQKYMNLAKTSSKVYDLSVIFTIKWTCFLKLLQAVVKYSYYYINFRRKTIQTLVLEPENYIKKSR